MQIWRYHIQMCSYSNSSSKKSLQQKMTLSNNITNETSSSKYIWEMKDKYNISPNLMWCIVKSVPGYLNISKRCMLSLHEKYEILNYPDQEELLNNKGQNLYWSVGMLTSFFCPIINQMISVIINCYAPLCHTCPTLWFFCPIL